MGKKGKKGQAGKPKKLTPKDVGKRLNALAKNLEEERKDADLFAPLPPTEDCAVCLVPLSRAASNSDYCACCGNSICYACYKQNKEQNATKSKPDTCPFCRELRPPFDEYVRQLQARALKNDYVALNNLAGGYVDGSPVLPKDDLKALDYLIRAVELGSPEACTQIGVFYSSGGCGVSKDMERRDLFFIVGAMRGDIHSRHNIGNSEYHDLGNHEIAIRHWKIAAEGGFQPSIDALKKVYNADGKIPGKDFISKESMDSIYRVCHDAQMEVKSAEREKHCKGRTKVKC